MVEATTDRRDRRRTTQQQLPPTILRNIIRLHEGKKRG
jgi:hypothetical protein